MGEVTQDDRDAFQELRGLWGPKVKAMLDEGDFDDAWEMKLLIRHRSLAGHTPQDDAADTVERVAKAIAMKTYAFATVTDEGSDQYDCGEWDGMGCDAQATYRDAARAALAAMRAPS